MFVAPAATTRGSLALRTTPLALPAAVFQQLHAGACGQGASVANPAGVPPSQGDVFGNDAGVLSLASVRGSQREGHVAMRLIGL